MFHTTSILILLGLSAGFPKPDLFSFDVGTLQVGAGFSPTWPGNLLLPDLGVSVGQARFYWGKKLALAAGLQLLRIELAGSSETGIFGTSEFFMPEVGFSYMFKERPVKSKACIGLFKRESFVPRFDMVCGFSAINPVLSGITGRPISFLPTLRVEVKYLINRSTQLVFENRNISCNTYSLSLCFTLGVDYQKENKGGKPD